MSEVHHDDVGPIQRGEISLEEYMDIVPPGEYHVIDDDDMFNTMFGTTDDFIQFNVDPLGFALGEDYPGSH